MNEDPVFMERRHNNFIFTSLLAVFFFVFLIQYILQISGSHSVRMPVPVDIILFMIFYFSYLWLYRRGNLLCYELMALPVAFLGLFFDDLVYPFVPELTGFYSVDNKNVCMKSESIQMMAFFCLLLGLVAGNIKRGKSIVKQSPVMDKDVSFDFLTFIISGILLLLIVYDYKSGVFSTWFYYSNSDWMDVDDRNEGLGHLTCLLLAATCVEIVRLRNHKVHNLVTFIKRCNKLYIAEIAGISGLLLLSGNRNEMLLILLPLVVGYTICIKRISNKLLLAACLSGVILMAAVGMSRDSSGSLNEKGLGLIAFTRDFACLGYDTDYLIDYTDKNGATYFGGTLRGVLSGVPSIGYFIISTFDIKGPVASATLTTESVLSNAGLGTSLIGDLYYTAGVVWVVMYLFGFGYLMSRLYHSDRDMNVYWLLFYSYMVANAVYYVRSSWMFPITDIEYAMFVVFAGRFVFKSKKVRKKVSQK